MPCKYFSATLAAASTALVLVSSPGIAAPGEQWEYQGTMDMMGFKMPIQPTKQCQGKDDPMTPPMGGNCRFTDVHRQGNTTRFAFLCSKPDEGSGSGTVTLTGNTSQSDYTIKTPDGEGTVKLSGRKLGECHYTPQAIAQGPAPEQTAAAQAATTQARAAQGAAANSTAASAKDKAASIEKQYCGSMVEKMSPTSWYTSMDSCVKQKPAFCKRMKTDAGLRQFAVTAAAEANMNAVFSLEKIGDECGVGDKAVTRAKVCKLSDEGREWQALKSFCTEPFRKQVLTHCAVGMQSELETTLVSKDGPQYDGLCKLADGGLPAEVVRSQQGGQRSNAAGIASDEASNSSSDNAATKSVGEAAGEAINAGKRTLKSLLKR